MYDPRHVVVVEPNAAAVEDAVAGFRSRAPDPGDIRRSALATARPHRLRLIDWLSGIVETDLRPHADENGWLPQFRDKLRQKWRVDRRSDGGLEARPLADPGAPTLQEA